MLRVEAAFTYGLFVFFATMAVYNGQRLFKADQLIRTPWLIWVGANKRALTGLVIVAFLCAMALLIVLQKRNAIAFAFLAVAGAISVLYVWKVKGRNLREIPYLKIHLIALAWTFLLILFPIYNEGAEVNALAVGFAHYAYIFALAIPFDIRDLKYDSLAQKTIPQVIGVQASKFLSSILLMIFSGTLAFQFPNLAASPLFYVAVLVQIVLVVSMNEQRSDMYCAGAIDGAIALLGLSYWLVN